MKKIMAICMATLLVVALVACGPKRAPEDDYSLTGLLEDLQEPGTHPEFNESTGHWEAVYSND